MHRTCPPTVRSATCLIIALATLAAGTVPQARAEAGDTRATERARALARGDLPTLANTDEGDRPLLREIGDDHVFDTAPDPDAAPRVAMSADAPVADDVWSRVRLADRLAVPDNDVMREQISRLRTETLWISKLLHRGTPFVGHVVEALDARYLPLELALLPLIESGYRPRATSSERAAGLWQIMPATASEIGVERSDWFDGRADIVTSTRAALDYLGYLNAEFHGDWELTLAAYNAGLGRVRTAIRVNREAGLGEDFWSLALPSETRAYVPKLLGLLALLREENGGLDVPLVPLAPAFVPVDVGRRISVDRAARVGGLPEGLLGQLNAGLVHGVTPPAGPHVLYLPPASRDDFLERLDTAGESVLFSLPHAHRVAVGDTLSGIALTYGITAERLMTLNGLDDSRIRVGQTLAVLDARHADGASVEHVVASGDTLSDIASRYGVDVDSITDSDGDTPAGPVIHPGDRLLVHLIRADAG